MRNTLKGQSATGYCHKKSACIVLQFLLLFAFWLVLSGHFTAKYIILGALSSGLVTFLTRDLFYSVFQHGKDIKTRFRTIFLQMWRFIVYLPWLLSRIIMANVQVAYLVLHPRMPINPAFFLFRTTMKKNISQVTLANSITLTPGTITVSLEDGNYIIHTLNPPLAQELADAVMQNKVAKIYQEEKEKPPITRLVYSLEELEK